MSKRLQVLMQDSEYERIQQAATSQHLAVGEFVRRELRRSCDSLSGKSIDEKLKAIQTALSHEFPVGTIEEINAEIELGYSHGLP
jgi:hypothetical protein